MFAVAGGAVGAGAFTPWASVTDRADVFDGAPAGIAEVLEGGSECHDMKLFRRREFRERWAGPLQREATGSMILGMVAISW